MSEQINNQIEPQASQADMDLEAAKRRHLENVRKRYRGYVRKGPAASDLDLNGLKKLDAMLGQQRSRV